MCASKSSSYNIFNWKDRSGFNNKVYVNLTFVSKLAHIDNTDKWKHSSHIRNAYLIILWYKGTDYLTHKHIYAWWRHQMETSFPRNWPFVLGIHRSPVNSPHKGQWRGALMFSLICVSRNDWVNNREAGDLRRYRAHYDVIVMISKYNTESRGL